MNFALRVSISTFVFGFSGPKGQFVSIVVAVQATLDLLYWRSGPLWSYYSGPLDLL